MPLAQEVGKAFAQQIRAYIDAEIDRRLANIQQPSAALADTGAASERSSRTLLIDPWTANIEPMSLPLPQAYKHVTAALQGTAGSEVQIVCVSANSWGPFLRRLLAAAFKQPEFLETAGKVQSRFSLNTTPAEAYQAEVIDLPAGSDWEPLQHWLRQPTQVHSAVVAVIYDAVEPLNAGDRQ